LAVELLTMSVAVAYLRRSKDLASMCHYFLFLSAFFSFQGIVIWSAVGPRQLWPHCVRIFNVKTKAYPTMLLLFMVASTNPRRLLLSELVWGGLEKAW